MADVSTHPDFDPFSFGCRITTPDVVFVSQVAISSSSFRGTRQLPTMEFKEKSDQADDRPAIPPEEALTAPPATQQQSTSAVSAHYFADTQVAWEFGIPCRH